MSTTIPELLVTEGPRKGDRFTVGEQGVRLGRSSSCEISIEDPALSRNHCLVEVRENALWITDLASANGTFVNERELGADSVRLAPGDVIEVGDTKLAVVAAGEEPAPAAASAPTAETTAETTVDLGLGGSEEAAAEETFDEGDGTARANPMRFVLWAVAAAAVGAAVWMILDEPSAPGAPSQPAPVVEEVEAVPGNAGNLVALSLEKVTAAPEGICRMALSFAANGELAVQIDDVPAANRHVEKTARLDEAKIARLEKIFKGEALYRLDSEYAGAALRPGELKSVALRVVRSESVFNVSVKNVPEPEALREVCEQFEAFAKNELGIWGIDKSVEELKTLSADARRTGDAKWEERDVQHGNLAQAIIAYEEAVTFLATVNPKPEGFDALVQRIREAKAELDRRYREQAFRADKAINLKDWKTALAELRVLCALVPDDRDARHAEANAKLLDVEARQKGGK